jgi:hypothetical protein
VLLRGQSLRIAAPRQIDPPELLPAWPFARNPKTMLIRVGHPPDAAA